MANSAQKESANECHTEETIVTSIKVGLKREFLNIIKSQEMFPITMGKRRTRSQENPLSKGVAKNAESYSTNPSNKRLKRFSPMKKVVKNKVINGKKGGVKDRAGIVGFISEKKESDKTMDEEPKDGVAKDVNAGLHIRSVNTAKRVPTKLKELLQTGLLEGLSVRYIRGTKAKAFQQIGLHGIICGTKIICFCDTCKGIKTITPNEFELHAHSANKRPPEYLYLENMKTLRDVLNACKGVSFDSLENIIRQAIIGCTSTKGAKHFVNNKVASVPAESVQFLNCKGTKHTNRSKKSSSRQPLRPRNKKLSSDSSTVGRRLTKRNLKIHQLIFQWDLLPDQTELSYFANGKRLLSGYKSGQGIYCNCCQTVVSPSIFQAHAGYPSRRKPYMNIFTDNGVSLHELLLEMKNIVIPSTDQNDQVCSRCEDTGMLVCCDNCPRAFHPGCVGLENIPEGKWYCVTCQTMIERAKRAELDNNAIAAGRISGVDPFVDIRERCHRLVKTMKFEEGGCVLCREDKFSELKFGPLTIIICEQCENHFHVGCLKEQGVDNLKKLPKEKWFCDLKCRRIHSALQVLVVGGERKLPSSLLDIIKKKHEGIDSQNNFDQRISWRVLHGRTTPKEDKQLLDGALSVLHEQFGPIMLNSVEDLIPLMIGRKIDQTQNYGGMYCAILVVNSKVVSAATFRVFGPKMAEIPLVATSKDFQSKGYFQSLFYCIEDFLASLKVKNLILPAAHKTKSLWRKKFGFKKINKEELKEYLKDSPVTKFEGTTFLHKPICKPALLAE